MDIMDPLVGASVLIIESSDNADLLDFCFLCSRQFFHDSLESFDLEILKDEEILASFFEELGPVERALLECCPSCKTVCKTLVRTKEALSGLIDEVFSLLLQHRKVSYLVSKHRVVSRLFQSSNSSLPPYDASTGLFQPNLHNFAKDISNTANSSNTSFPSQFDLRLDSSNLSDSLDIPFLRPLTPVSTSQSKRFSSPKKQTKNDKERQQQSPFLVPPASCSSNSSFTTLYNDSIMNSISDNACDVSEGVIRETPEQKFAIETTRPYSLPTKLPLLVSPQLHSVQVQHKEDSSVPKADEEKQMTSLVKADAENRNARKQIKMSDPDPRKLKLKEKRKRKVPTVNSKSGKRKNTSNSCTNASSKDLKASTDHYCQDCNKYFQTARNLKNHLSAHADERKYICEICGSGYRRKKDLEGHVAIHKRKPMFKCGICEKSFTQRTGLQRHLAVHNGTKNYQCDHCGQHFFHHTSLKAHQQSHGGTKEVECSECDLKFSSKSHLHRHMKIHTGEKLHECQFCDRSFSERYNLRVHLREIHENQAKKSFSCMLCPKQFSRKAKLKLHVTQNHTG